MSDLISRQAAIDAIEFGITYAKAINKETGEVKELFQASNDELRKAEDRIKQLPSAQPEIIRCKDCKYNTYSKKCLQPDSFFLVPADDFYCGYAERRTDG